METFTYEVVVILWLGAYGLACCGLILLRNDITLEIRLRWIDEHDFSTGLLPAPEYQHCLNDLTLWKYVPLEEYMKRVEKRVRIK